MTTNTDTEEVVWSEKEIEGFKVAFFPNSTNYAYKDSTEVDTTDTHFIVEKEEGSGYGREKTRAYIPFEVIAEMMRNAGYICHRKE